MRKRRGGKKMEARVALGLELRAAIDRLIEWELSEFMRAEAQELYRVPFMPGPAMFEPRAIVYVDDV